jgi:hypothetical protein
MRERGRERRMKCVSVCVCVCMYAASEEGNWVDNIEVCQGLDSLCNVCGVGM